MTGSPRLTWRGAGARLAHTTSRAAVPATKTHKIANTRLPEMRKDLRCMGQGFKARLTPCQRRAARGGEARQTMGTSVAMKIKAPPPMVRASIDSPNRVIETTSEKTDCNG